MTAPPELLRFLDAYPRYLIAGHKEPDGDCVGSQLALVSLLRRRGKEAVACSAGPFKRPEIASVASLFTDKPTEEQRRDAAVILVDCSRLERAGSLAKTLSELPLAIIDHHVSENEPSHLHYIDAACPAATILVEAIMRALSDPPNKEEASWLLFGLCTDTGFFRHLDSGSAEAFDCAARLTRQGASPKSAFQAINGGKTLESRILMGLILSRTSAYYDGRLLVSYEKRADTKRFGLQGRDSDAIYQALLSVNGVEAIILARQESAKLCTVGLRSRDSIRVDSVAARFGGGGHKNASGLSAEGTLKELLPLLIDAFADQFCK